MTTPETPLSRAHALAQSTGAPAYIYAQNLPKTYAVGDAVYHETRMIVSDDASLPFRRVRTVTPYTRTVPDFGV